MREAELSAIENNNEGTEDKKIKNDKTDNNNLLN